MLKNAYGTLSISGYTVTGTGTYFHLSDEGDMLFIVGHPNVYEIAEITGANQLYLSEKVAQTITDDKYAIVDSATAFASLPLAFAELADNAAGFREAFYRLDSMFVEKGL